MLNLNIDSFLVSFKDGSIENVGAPNKSATAKLFDATAVELREFGDSQAKVVARDEEGNEVQIALFPEQVESIVDDAAALREGSSAFE